MKTIITIGRQFGSGGKEVGIRVAKELGIPFYDKELLQEAAKKSGLCQKIFENFDERPKSLLYAIAMDAYPLGFSGATGESLEQQVHLAIFKTIRHIAEEGPCVIIGRSADYALAENPNLLSLFISAPLEDRIARVAKRQKVTPEEAKSLIQKTDKRRASYCEYYASKKWGAVDAYDFCLNSSALGLGGTVELIQAMVAHKEHPIPSPRRSTPPRPRHKRFSERPQRGRSACRKSLFSPHGAGIHRRPSRFPCALRPKIGGLPRNRLVLSATGGTSPVSPPWGFRAHPSPARGMQHP